MGPIETALAVGSTAVAVPLAKDLLSKLLGPSAIYLGDKLRDNLIAVLGKVESMAREAGVEVRQVPARTGVPILEAAKLEDNEWMQNWWAALLLNASTSDSETLARPAYAEILKQLSPQDARFLDMIYRTAPSEDRIYYSWWDLQDLYLSVNELEAGFEIEFGLILENLTRLGLLWADPRPIAKKSSGYRFAQTSLGFGLLHACRGPVRSSEGVIPDDTPSQP